MDELQNLIVEDKEKQDSYRQLLIEKTIKPDLFLVLQDNWHREFKDRLQEIENSFINNK
jgi:hypothetical protein